MTSGSWLREHESLAALVYSVLSFALIGAFAWLERRFFGKKRAPAYSQPSSPLLNLILVIALRYTAIKKKIFSGPPIASDPSLQAPPETSSSTAVRPR
jgi:hypothetical protein